MARADLRKGLFSSPQPPPNAPTLDATVRTGLRCGSDGALSFKLPGPSSGFCLSRHPSPAPPSGTQTPRLNHFIANALYRMRLHSSITFATLYLLQHLKPGFLPQWALLDTTTYFSAPGDQPDRTGDVLMLGVAAQRGTLNSSRLSKSCPTRFCRPWPLSTDGHPRCPHPSRTKVI
jgi:hypothetical protein